MSDRNSSDDDYEMSEDDISTREKPMGFLEHLDELRGTLVKCAIAFVVFACLIGIFLKESNDVLMWPLNHVRAENAKLVLDLGTSAPMEGFSVIIQMCTMGGFMLAAPFMLFFIGQFVAPALSEKELKAVLPVCLSAMFLFLMGASFSFFLLVPSTLRVAVEINDMFGFVMRWTPASYYSLLLWLVMGVGASFEFPLLIVLAVYLGFLKVATLRKFRRHAIVVIFVIAAIVTPTPDPFTQTMMAVPLYVLFELAIIAGARVEKRKREAAIEV
ncbi:twin-arginine translocase subunit TatC [Rariglobus hedericola]|nr:twin-arginine translocase subunit TatC [Rariglobus hedericola]